MTPADWDRESYCTVNRCHQPATHERLDDFTDDGTPIVALVCCQHAQEPT